MEAQLSERARRLDVGCPRNKNPFEEVETLEGVDGVGASLLLLSSGEDMSSKLEWGPDSVGDRTRNLLAEGFLVSGPDSVGDRTRNLLVGVWEYILMCWW